MAPANETPRAFEAPAQIASAHELRQLAQDTFGLGIQPGADPAMPARGRSQPPPR